MSREREWFKTCSKKLILDLEVSSGRPYDLSKLEILKKNVLSYNMILDSWLKKVTQELEQLKKCGVDTTKVLDIKRSEPDYVEDLLNYNPSVEQDIL